MTDYGDLCHAMRAHRRQQKTRWAERHMKRLQEARDLAFEHDMDLAERRPGIHYQLCVYRDDGSSDLEWLWNLYPSTGRIYTDPHHQGPFLEVPRDWSFVDVVKAAVKAAEKK